MIVADNSVDILVNISGQDELNDLFDKIRDGTASIDDQARAVKLGTALYKSWGSANESLKSSLAGSIATIKDLKDQALAPLNSTIANTQRQYFDMGAGLRDLGLQEKGVTDIIRQSRGERRMYMYATREAEQAITSITGENSVFAKSLSEGTSSVFGIKFALDAMGMSLYALPIALVIGLFTVLRTLIKDSTVDMSKFRDEQIKEIDILIKLGRATTQQKLDLISAQIVEENSVLSKMKSVSTLSSLLSLMTGGKFGGGGASPEEILKQQEKIDALTLSYKETVESVNKNETKDLKDQVAEHDKLIDLEWRDHEITLQEYGTELNLRLLRAEKLKDLTAEHELRKQLKDLYTITLPDVTVTPNRRQLAERYQATHQGTPPAKEEKKEEFDATKEYLLNPLKSGFQSLAYSGLQGFNKMWEHSSAFARTALGQAFEQIADKLISTVEDKIEAALIDKGVTALLKYLHLAGGGDVSYGSALKFAANGINVSYGKGVQNVMVGEQGTELMQVGENGVRVISHSNLQSAQHKGATALLKYLAGGGDVSYGSALKFAANGINVSYGKGVQNVMVGEQGTELMQVGENGVRVISHSNLQSAQLGISSGGGSNSALLGEMRMMNLNFARLQAASNTGVYMMTEQGGKTLRGRSRDV